MRLSELVIATAIMGAAVVLGIAPAFAQDGAYAEHERARWADPTVNRYSIECSATRDTQGAEPLEFYAKAFRDADYVSMLALVNQLEKLGTIYTEAMAQWIGLPVEEQTAAKLVELISLE